MTGRGWRGLSARMSERKAQPEASFAAAAISGKEAEPWRVGIADWFMLRRITDLDIQDKWGRFNQPSPSHTNTFNDEVVKKLAEWRQPISSGRSHNRTLCARACHGWP